MNRNMNQTKIHPYSRSVSIIGVGCTPFMYTVDNEETNGLTEGDYTLIDFQTEPEAIAELDRVLHIMDAVVRYMIVRRDDRLDSVENA